MKIFDLEIGVTLNSKGISSSLKRLEKEGRDADKSLSQIGDGAERSQKKATSAFGKIANSLRSLKASAKGGVNVHVKTDERELDSLEGRLRAFERGEISAEATVDASQAKAELAELKKRYDQADGRNVTTNADFNGGAAAAGMAAYDRVRESIDGKEINTRADFDGAGAVAGMGSFSAAMSGVLRAAQGMDSGVSAGGVRIAMIGSIAATAAALFAPLLGALAAVGSLGAAAGAGIGLIATPLAMVVSRLTSYHESLDKASTAQNTLSSSSDTLATAQKGVEDAERQRETALENLATATEEAARSQRTYNDALEDEPTNQAQNELDLEGAVDREDDARKQYNADVAEFGKTSEEATDSLRDWKQAQLDLDQQERDSQRIRERGSEQLQSAEQQRESALRGVEAAADQVEAAERAVAAAQLAVANAAEKQTAAQVELNEATEVLPPALLKLYNAVMRFKDAANVAFTPAQNAIARLGTSILTDVTPALGILGKVSTAAVGALSVAWSDFLTKFTAPVQRSSVLTILASVNDVVKPLASSIGNVFLALINIFAAATPSAISLAQTIERISMSLLSWSQTTGGVLAVRSAVATAVPVFSALWTLVQEVGAALFRLGVENGPAIATAIGYVSQAVVWLINGFSHLTQTFGPIVPVIAALTPVALGILMIFGQVGAVLANIVGAGIGVVGFFVGLGTAILPVTAVVLALVAAGILLYRNWSTVRSVFASVASALGAAFSFLKSAAAPAIAQIQAALTQLRYALMPVGMVANSVIRGMLGAAFAFLLSQGRLVMAWWRQNLPLIKTLIAVNFRAAGIVVSTVIRAIASVIRTVFGGAIAFYRANSTQIRTITTQVWNIVRTIISTVIRTVLGIVRAALLLLTGNWRGAFAQLQQVSQTVMSAIVSILRSLLSILVNLFVIGWNNLKTVTSAAFSAVRDYIVNRISEAKSQAISTIEGLKSAASSAWEAIKSGASSAWKAIAGFITEPIGSAVGTVKGFLDDLIGLVNKVLDAVGLKPLQVSFDTGGETTGGRPETGAFARGGDTGGLGTRSKNPRVHEWNEQYGNEAYIVENRPTSEQYPYLRTAAAWHGYDLLPRKLNKPSHRGGSDLTEMHSHARGGITRRFMYGGFGKEYFDAAAAALDREVMSRFPVSGSSYAGHPTGSVDFLVSQGEAQGKEKELGDAVAGWLDSNYEALNLRALIWFARARYEGGPWQDYVDNYGGGSSDYASQMHLNHPHAQSLSASFGKLNEDQTKGFEGGGGGGGGTISVPNPKQILFEQTWDKLVKPVVDRILSPMEDASYVMLQAVGKMARKVPQGIYQWIDEKIPDMTGGGSGGDLPGGNSPSGLTIGEALSQGGWPDDLLVEGSSTVWNESRGIADARNPSGARGLMQIMPQTAEGVGADYDKLDDPVYNTTAGKKVYDQAGGWGPWVGAGQGGDYRNEPVTGYSKGGLALSPQLALIGDTQELMLPLDNAQVMRSAQTALGTAELRQTFETRMTSLERALVNKLDRVNLDTPTIDRQLEVVRTGTLGTLGSLPGRQVIEKQQREISRQIAGRGGRP